jgi:hypothetical protein
MTKPSQPTRRNTLAKTEVVQYAKYLLRCLFISTSLISSAAQAQLSVTTSQSNTSSISADGTATTNVTHAVAESTSKELEFLSALHELLKNPPLTVERVSQAFGWQVNAPQPQDETSAAVHTTFNMHPKQPWISPRLVENSVLGRQNFSLQFTRDDACLSADGVFKTFGKNFKPTISLFSRDIDINKSPAIVKTNQAIFQHGPRYEFKNLSYHVTAYFAFNFSECAESISISASKT